MASRFRYLERERPARSAYDWLHGMQSRTSRTEERYSVLRWTKVPGRISPKMREVQQVRTSRDRRAERYDPELWMEAIRQVFSMQAV
jgi:hypothetical protein